MGTILVKDELGNFKPDFGLMKRKAREEQKVHVDARPLSEEERK